MEFVRIKKTELEAYKKEIKDLRKKNASLKKKVKLLKAELEKLKLELEEMKMIVFKKRTKKDEDEKSKQKPKSKNKRKPSNRDKKTYKREIPKEEDITSEKDHKIDNCPECWKKLKRKITITFYEEDIIVWDKKKTWNIIKNNVEKGYCNNCKKWYSAISVPSTKVILGPIVKIYIVYLNILLRLSYKQIQDVLRDTYKFKISDWEIAKILDNSSRKLKWEFEKIKLRLREDKWIHLDETSWWNKYLWTGCWVNWTDVVYLANRSRWKENAKEILWYFNWTRITDWYWVYINLRWDCQLCWAHPHRKIKDLSNSSKLSKKKKKHCKKEFKYFSEIYSKLRSYLKEEFDINKRKIQKKELITEILNFAKINDNDPEKLKSIKKSFERRLPEWFTCMDYDKIPCDNNKAERMLRHFVIKRKISFWNKTDKWAKAFEINASVFMSYWGKYKDNFFENIFPLYL